MTERVTFKNSKGQKIVGALDRPDKENPPVIIVCNSWARDKNLNPMGGTGKFFSENGFAVLRFDFAGVGESEGDEKELSIQTEADDLQSAINYIICQSINKKQIYLIGHSMGGTAVAIASNSIKIKINALVMWSPVGDYKLVYEKYYLKNKKDLDKKGYFIRHSYSRNKDVFTGKNLMENFRTINLDEIFSKIMNPTLLIYPKDDELSLDMKRIEKLTKLITVEKKLLEIPGNHNFDGKQVVNNLYKETLKWFKKYL